MSVGTGMNDESAEVGAAAPAPSVAWDAYRPAAGERPDGPVADKAAHDAEFSLFYHDDMPRLVGYLIVQGVPPGLAADIAQEAMTSAYREWDVIDFPKGWVRRVAARRWWKLAANRSEIPHDELPEHSGLLDEPLAEVIANRHDLLRLLAELPEQQRTIMAWTYDEYRPTEIAALLGMNPATVRSLLRDARAKLRDSYRPGEETP